MVRMIFFLYMCCLLLTASQVRAQALGQGTVVRVMSDELVFIDLGSNASIVEEDLFDLVSNEIVYHPLRPDSVLVTTPQEVGILKVIQVYPKMALAKLIHLKDGEDPMLKQVRRISNPERLVEAEIFLEQKKRESLGGGSKRAVLIPGLYQIKMGKSYKGWTLLGLEAVSLITAFSYRASSDSWKEQYDNLPPGLPAGDYDRYFETARDHLNWSKRFFWVAGAVYAYSCFDVLLNRGGAPMNLQRSAPRAFELGWGFDSRGHALLQLGRRF